MQVNQNLEFAFFCFSLHTLYLLTTVSLVFIFLSNTARDICPCVWITSPDETTYILKTILRLAGVSLEGDASDDLTDGSEEDKSDTEGKRKSLVNLSTVASRNSMMDVYTGEMLSELK